jgi:hypothetical protein
MVANVPWEYDTKKGAGPSDFAEISQGQFKTTICTDYDS